MNRRVIDLFCGIGGLSLGAVRAGFNLTLSVDRDAIAMATHKKNFPNNAHLTSDISGLSGELLLENAGLRPGELTGLIGGPPCQGFSRIGRRKSRDRRNTLFSHFFRLVKETEPEFFLAENVPGILDKSYRRSVKKALGQVGEQYVMIAPFKLTASDFGAPTDRERVFFIGWKKSLKLNLTSTDFRSEKWDTETKVGIALSGLRRRLGETWLTDSQGWRKLTGETAGMFGVKLSSVPAGLGDPDTVRKLKDHGLVSGSISTLHTANTVKRFSEVKPGAVDSISRFPRLHRQRFCPTLRAGTGSDRGSFQAARPIHFSENRVITLREAARLQGFPDWFRFHETKWHSFRGIGNSVSPLIAEAVLGAIIKKLPADANTPPRSGDTKSRQSSIKVA